MKKEWWKHIKFSCRICAHSTPTEQSTWVCEKFDKQEIPLDFQRTGCEQGTIHPDIVPWEYRTERDYVIWLTPYGEIAQGNPDAHIYSAAEVLANPEACAKGVGDEIRAMFDGRVVG